MKNGAAADAVAPWRHVWVSTNGAAVRTPSAPSRSAAGFALRSAIAAAMAAAVRVAVVTNRA